MNSDDYIDDDGPSVLCCAVLLCASPRNNRATSSGMFFISRWNNHKQNRWLLLRDFCALARVHLSILRASNNSSLRTDAIYWLNIILKIAIFLLLCWTRQHFASLISAALAKLFIKEPALWSDRALSSRPSIDCRCQSYTHNSNWRDRRKRILRLANFENRI